MLFLSDCVGRRVSESLTESVSQWASESVSERRSERLSDWSSEGRTSKWISELRSELMDQLGFGAVMQLRIEWKAERVANWVNGWEGEWFSEWMDKWQWYYAMSAAKPFTVAGIKSQCLWKPVYTFDGVKFHSTLSHVSSQRNALLPFIPLTLIWSAYELCITASEFNYVELTSPALWHILPGDAIKGVNRPWRTFLPFLGKVHLNYLHI